MGPDPTCGPAPCHSRDPGTDETRHRGRVVLEACSAPAALLAEVNAGLLGDAVGDVHTGAQAGHAHAGRVGRHGHAALAAQAEEEKKQEPLSAKDACA